MSETTTASLGQKADRSARSTSAMLRAAGELIDEGGFASLTLASIGERAGFSRGLVTARFGSKEGLIEALLDNIVGRWNHTNVLPQAIERSGFDGALYVLDAIKRQAARDPRTLKVLYKLMFEAVGPNPILAKRFAELHREIRTDFVRLLKRGIKDGSVRSDVDVKNESILIVSGLRGAVYQWLLDPTDFDVVAALDHLIDATAERIRPIGEPTT